MPLPEPTVQTAAQPVTLTNDGTAPLYVSSLTLTGADPTAFSIASGGDPVNRSGNDVKILSQSVRGRLMRLLLSLNHAPYRWRCCLRARAWTKWNTSQKL